ncbi:MAG: DNA replication/repair protein RecF [Opitutales bacterium]
MRFRNLRLQNFRNFDLAELPLGGERHFLLGENGQGKSNLLEALGLTTALRSFRTQSLSALPRKGHRAFTLVYEIEHEEEGLVCIEIHSGAGGRSVRVDGEKVTRLVDYIGRFPVVALSSGDLMLLRGGPSERRRFMDLTFSVVNRGYYLALRDFHRGVAERNRLLKSNGSAAELSAFEAEMSVHAAVIARVRAEGVAHLKAVLADTYNRIAEAGEGPEMLFNANTDCLDPENYRKILQDGRARDQIIGSTQRGPHRDDFGLSLRVGGAREYASDGQQRGLCVALRIAQASYFEAELGRMPVLLADDVLGELDPVRRKGFWRACPEAIQIVATGTELPSNHTEWSTLRVSEGRLAKA